MTLAFDAQIEMFVPREGWVPWPPERDDVLKKLFFDGASYFTMAHEIGVSIQAIKGRIYRLGIRRDAPLNERWIGKTDSLEQLWAEGHTAAVIAAQLGTTRNAVLGKVFRLGLPKRDKNKSYRVARPRASMNVGSLVVSLRRASKPRLVKAKPVRITCEAFDAAIPRDQLKPVWEIRTNECHWPVGDPGESGFGFCCAATEEHIYCEEHRFFAYDKKREPFRKQVASFGTVGRAA